MESFSEVINNYPPALPLMLTAWLQIETKPSQVVIAGTRGAEDTEALLRIVESTFSKPRLLLLADGAENQRYLAQNLPFIGNVVPLEGKATAYVCEDFTCKSSKNYAIMWPTMSPVCGISGEVGCRFNARGER